jgi:hypothetical protein
MEKKVSSGLRTLFLVHFIIGGIFGLIYLLIPEIWGGLIGWPVQEVLPYRLIGAAVLGYAASSWWCYKTMEWEKVKIVVQMEMVWPTLGALVMLYGLILGGLPAVGWLNAIILGGFAIAFIYFYTKA